MLFCIITCKRVVAAETATCSRVARRSRRRCGRGRCDRKNRYVSRRGKFAEIVLPCGASGWGTFQRRLRPPRAPDMVRWKPNLSKSGRRGSSWFKYSQIIGPLLPIPVGCYLLYKAIKSFNRNPPPIATDSKTVLERPLYGEPIYQRVSFAPSTIARNMSPRSAGGT